MYILFLFYYFLRKILLHLLYYFQFVKQCRDAGITVPIIPGIKILTSKRQLSSIPKNFYVDLPDELVDEVNLNPQHILYKSYSQLITLMNTTYKT